MVKESSGEGFAYCLSGGTRERLYRAQGLPEEINCHIRRGRSNPGCRIHIAGRQV